MILCYYMYICDLIDIISFSLQHGRLKVKTTAEQAEAKRLERLKKQKLYQGATAKIYAKVGCNFKQLPFLEQGLA